MKMLEFFDQLVFQPHPYSSVFSIATDGIFRCSRHTFENGYEVSVITEPSDSSKYELAILYDDEILYDVVIDGEVCGDTLRCLTEEEVDCTMKQVSELETRDTSVTDTGLADQLLSGLQ